MNGDEIVIIDDKDSGKRIVADRRTMTIKIGGYTKKDMVALKSLFEKKGIPLSVEGIDFTSKGVINRG
jgi:hypothetical protein